METINDIVDDIRAQNQGLPEDGYALSPYVHDLLSLADRIEAAIKRERESITPRPDPDWKDICAKCKDGDIEPKHCEYYGEPNGCNSPIYGEHPTTENSSAVGNAAKMREALRNADIVLSQTSHGYHSPVRQEIKAALAEPSRNCDVFDGRTIEDEFEKAMGFPPSQTENERYNLMRENWFLFKAWLFAEAKGETK